MKRYISFFITFIAGAFFGGKLIAYNINPRIRGMEKTKQIATICEQWMKYENNGNKIESYLINNGYSNIVVYGGAALGEILVGRLRKSDIVNVVAVMDRDDTLEFGDIPTILSGVVPKETDCVVVTTVGGQFESIKEELLKYNKVKVIDIMETLR